MAALHTICPQAVTSSGVSRDILKRHITADPSLLLRIESAVHPLVAADRQRFLTSAVADLVVLDIPLLFEKGTEADLDATLLVTASPQTQRARVLARPGMTEEAFALILARQMPDGEKRARATHILETLSLELAQAYVLALINHIRQHHA